MADISTLEIICYGLISFCAAVFSGVAGGGAGFINIPILILFGLSPAQAIATTKLTGLSVALSSLSGLKKVKIRSRREPLFVIILALIVGLLAPLMITGLNSELYQRLIGLLLIALAPILLLKRTNYTQRIIPNRTRKIVGMSLLIVALGLQAVFGAGLGSFVNIILMAVLGMSALEANLTKRYSQVVLNVAIVAGVLFSGLIVWPIAAVGIVANGIGGFIGGRIAVKKGDSYVVGALAIVMALSGVALLINN